MIKKIRSRSLKRCKIEIIKHRPKLHFTYNRKDLERYRIVMIKPQTQISPTNSPYVLYRIIAVILQGWRCH